MDELVRQCRHRSSGAPKRASFGGDSQSHLRVGHSAGGHLAAMLMSTDWSAFAGLPPTSIKAGCGISGLYDLEPIRLSYLNEVLKLTPEDARVSARCTVRRRARAAAARGRRARRA
jgi:hypothetical protein